MPDLAYWTIAGWLLVVILAILLAIAVGAYSNLAADLHQCHADLRVAEGKRHLAEQRANERGAIVYHFPAGDAG